MHIPAGEAGQRWRISSRVDPAETPFAKSPAAACPDLAAKLLGGAPLYKEVVTVAGKIDVDPAGKGTGYALDEIPVPTKNPYGMPMTTSGLAFDKDGAAYLSTLVGEPEP